ncbi:fungal specific transcription factor domain-containing protein [Metarhizium guizhouense ARSEF 977]|uniref:Fungal specific transcription factor domain-containing protein n=1 Tax=Metarhizium guizhouense (strain ARSEF 977) TaxID=1276136 RepID=A0A0B4HVY4_METGA|nr:fungal specific transcription factor domain-containing protein [Metarhizium guizhouense ARSEF 977]
MTSGLVDVFVLLTDQPEWGTEMLGLGDLLFKGAIESFERISAAYEHGAGWLLVGSNVVKRYLQLDVLVGMASHLCQRPCGSLADRAWSLLGNMYGQHEELFDMGYKRARLLAKCTLLAWKVREEWLKQTGEGLDMPPYIIQLLTLQSGCGILYVVSGRDPSCHSLYLHEAQI